MATPNTAPQRCNVLETPEALPSCPGGTALSAAAEPAGTTIAMPTPASRKGMT